MLNTVVQVYGIPKVMKDPQQLLEHLHDLTSIHEANQEIPWQLSDAPADFMNKLTAAIVGFEIPITKISGKWKLGQNRPESDQLGMITGLKATDDQQQHNLADELEKYMKS